MSDALRRGHPAQMADRQQVARSGNRARPNDVGFGLNPADQIRPADGTVGSQPTI